MYRKKYAELGTDYTLKVWDIWRHKIQPDEALTIVHETTQLINLINTIIKIPEFVRWNIIILVKHIFQSKCPEIINLNAIEPYRRCDKRLSGGHIYLSHCSTISCQ